MINRSRLALLVVTVMLGCGSSSKQGDASPGSCGDQTCGPAQYCIHPCCGGAPPQCTPLPASGQCDPGTHAGCLAPGTCSASQCCQADPCTPPPPFCASQPQGECNAARSCVLACGWRRQSDRICAPAIRRAL